MCIDSAWIPSNGLSFEGIEFKASFIPYLLFSSFRKLLEKQFFFDCLFLDSFY